MKKTCRNIYLLLLKTSVWKEVRHFSVQCILTETTWLPTLDMVWQKVLSPALGGTWLQMTGALFFYLALSITRIEQNRMHTFLKKVLNCILFKLLSQQSVNLFHSLSQIRLIQTSIFLQIIMLWGVIPFKWVPKANTIVLFSLRWKKNSIIFLRLRKIRALSEAMALNAPDCQWPLWEKAEMSPMLRYWHQGQT